MALKKSELYSSRWSSCAGQPYAPIAVPPGASFKDMVALESLPPSHTPLRTWGSPRYADRAEGKG